MTSGMKKNEILHMQYYEHEEIVMRLKSYQLQTQRLEARIKYLSCAMFIGFLGLVFLFAILIYQNA